MTAQANLLTTAEVEAQVVLETAVAAQSLQATSEAQVNEMAATATAQLPTPLPAPAEPQPLEPDQETLAYQLALEAELILKEQPALLERSVLLAIEAVQRHPNAGAVEILKNGISLLPSHEKTLNHQDFGYNLAYSPDGQYVASSYSLENVLIGSSRLLIPKSAAFTGAPGEISNNSHAHSRFIANTAVTGQPTECLPDTQ